MSGRLTRALLAVILALAALSLPVIPGRTAAQGSYAQQTIAQVNAYRAAFGLNALAAHPSLMQAAQGHADWMVRTGSRGHTGEGGSAPWQRAQATGYPTTGANVFENWVGGRGMSPSAAVSWWDSSAIHRQTMTLPADYQHIGVGVAESGETRIYVLLIGKPSDPPTPTPDPNAGPPPTPGPPTPTPYYVEPIIPAAPDAEGTIIHTVGEGQTAWAIAVVYNVDLETMLQINGLKRPVFLHPGDEVIVKLGPNATPPPRAPKSHTVQDGESAWTVAAYYGITLDELLIANELERPAILQPGDVLTIPPPQPLMTPTPIPTPEM